MGSHKLIFKYKVVSLTDMPSESLHFDAQKISLYRRINKKVNVTAVVKESYA